MDEINFLANKKEESDDKKIEKKKNKEPIAWSEPEESLSQDGTPSAKGWFAVLNKAKAGSAIKKADQGKIKKSRKELLELIKQHEKYQKNIPKEKIETDGSGLFAWFKKRFKKLEHKEMLVDYQKIFNSEKEKRKTDKSFNTERKGEKKKKDEVAIGSEEKITELIPPLAPIKKDNELKKEVVEVKTEQPEKEKKREEKQERGLKKSEILQTNLIKGEIVTFFDWRQKTFNLISAIIIPCLIVTLAYLGMIFFQKYKEAGNQDLTDKYNDLELQIGRSEKDLNDILAFQKKLKIATNLIDQHIYWTNFFKFLEDNTIADVYFVDFSGDTRGSYNLNAISKNYNNISEQLKVLKENNKVSKVNVKGGTLSQKDNQTLGNNVNFNLELTIDPKLFQE